MKVKIPGLEGVAFIVKFVHTNIEEPAIKHLSGVIKEEGRLIRHTECKILQAEDGKEDLGFISIGYAKCHPKDNFNKEIGRQLSLRKALEDGEFTKESRSHFWDVYRDWGKSRF